MSLQLERSRSRRRSRSRIGSGCCNCRRLAEVEGVSSKPPGKCKLPFGIIPNATLTQPWVGQRRRITELKRAEMAAHPAGRGDCRFGHSLHRCKQLEEGATGAQPQLLVRSVKASTRHEAGWRAAWPDF